jgi:hypothetical protein
MLHILVSRALSRFVRRLYRRALGGYASTRPRPRHQGITKWINVGKPKPFSSLKRTLRKIAHLFQCLELAPQGQSRPDAQLLAFRDQCWDGSEARRRIARFLFINVRA